MMACLSNYVDLFKTAYEDIVPEEGIQIRDK